MKRPNLPPMHAPAQPERTIVKLMALSMFLLLCLITVGDLFVELPKEPEAAPAEKDDSDSPSMIEIVLTKAVEGLL